MPKFDLPLNRRLSLLWGVLLGAYRQNFPQTADGNPGLAHLADDPAQPPSGPSQHSVVHDKGNQSAARHIAFHRLPGAEEHDHSPLGHIDKIPQAPIKGHQPAHLNPPAGKLGVLRPKLVQRIAFPAKGFHHPDSSKIFLRHGGELALGFVRRAKPAADQPVKQPGIPHNDGNTRKSGGGQRRVDGKHQPKSADQHRHNAQQVGELSGGKIAHRVHIRGAALHNVAGLHAHMPAIRQALDMVKQPLAQGKGQALAELGGQILPQHIENGGNRHRRQKNPGQQNHMPLKPGPASQRLHPVQQKTGQLHGLVADDGIHKKAHQRRRYKRSRHAGEHGGHAGGERSPIASHQLQNEAAVAPCRRLVVGRHIRPSFASLVW